MPHPLDSHRLRGNSGAAAGGQPGEGGWTGGVHDRFIVLEGLDGAGTTTQVALVDAEFRRRGLPSLATYEPTDSSVGRLLREVISGRSPMAAQSLALLFAADRSEHLHSEPDGVLATLQRGATVISDRYLFSSLAYQSLDTPFEVVVELNRHFVLPRHVFFLDTPPEVCQQRVSSRERRELFELPDAQRSLRDSYQRVLHYFADGPVQVHLVDGDGSREDVFARIWKTLEQQPILTR